MTEWGVVGVIVVLVGLFVTFATPLIKAIKAMTRLTVSVENLTKEIESLKSDNETEHDRLWAHNDKQDSQIEDHEKRIIRIEERND